MHPEELDGVILTLLTTTMAPMTRDELVRETEDEPGTKDAVGRLRRAGMVHLLADDFLVASVAGRYVAELGGLCV